MFRDGHAEPVGSAMPQRRGFSLSRDSCKMSEQSPAVVKMTKMGY